MELMVLGSGTCIPHVERTAPGLMLRHDEFAVLLDPGPGTVHKLARYGVDYRRVGEVWITHLHPDHHADLVPLLFARKNAFEKLQTLVVRSGQPFEEILDSLGNVYGDFIQSELSAYRFEPLQLSGGVLETSGIRLEWQPVEHGEWALAFRAEAGGKSLVYSGDSGLCDSLIELARDADLLVAECSFPDELKQPGHMTPIEVAELAESSDAAKLVLVHLYPQCDPTSKVLSAVREHYSGNVEIAKEGETYTI